MFNFKIKYYHIRKYESSLIFKDIFNVTMTERGTDTKGMQKPLMHS